jgi:hypothetical protein
MESKICKFLNPNSKIHISKVSSFSFNDLFDNDLNQHKIKIWNHFLSSDKYSNHDYDDLDDVYLDETFMDDDLQSLLQSTLKSYIINKMENSYDKKIKEIRNLFEN